MRFRRNPAFESELRAEPRFQEGMRAQAEEVKRHVVAIAPRGRTGMYHRSIEVRRVPRVAFVGRLAELAGPGGGENYAVVTTDFAGHIVEWGSVNSPVYAPLRRGVRAAGLRLTELPKP